MKWLKPLEIQFWSIDKRRLKMMAKETNTQGTQRETVDWKRNKWIRRTVALLLKTVFFQSLRCVFSVRLSEKERATHVLLRNSMISIIDRSIGSAAPISCLFFSSQLLRCGQIRSFRERKKLLVFFCNNSNLFRRIESQQNNIIKKQNLSQRNWNSTCGSRLCSSENTVGVGNGVDNCHP